MNDLLSLLRKAVPESGLFFGDAPELVVERVSTGIPPLDMLLGGGLPRRRMTLLVGENAAGKSFVAQKFTAHFLSQNLSVVYADVERCFDPTWARHLGVPLENRKFIISQPSTGESAVDIVTEALRNEVDLVILDSIAMLAPVKLLEAGAENIFIGLLARLLSPAISRWQQANKHSVLLLINQIRDVIGTPIHETRFPGGKLQYYASSLTIKVRRRGYLKEKDRRIGFPMVFRVEKTKIPGVTPFSSCEIPFLFNGSLDVIESLVNLAIERGIIRKEGAHYYLGDTKIFGRNNVITLFRENTDLVGLLTEADDEFRGIEYITPPVSPGLAFGEDGPDS